MHKNTITNTHTLLENVKMLNYHSHYKSIVMYSVCVFVCVVAPVCSDLMWAPPLSAPPSVGANKTSGLGWRWGQVTCQDTTIQSCDPSVSAWSGRQMCPCLKNKKRALTPFLPHVGAGLAPAEAPLRAGRVRLPQHHLPHVPVGSEARTYRSLHPLLEGTFADM